MVANGNGNNGKAVVRLRPRIMAGAWPFIMAYYTQSSF